MKLNNRGSVLIFTLITFSIIITISIMCINLVYRNAQIVSLEHEENILWQNAKSGIEILENNILEILDNNSEEITNSEEFIKYYQSSEFINSITNSEKSKIEGIELGVIDKSTENNNIIFHVSSTAKIDNYSKRIECIIEIISKFSDTSSDDELIKITYESV